MSREIEIKMLAEEAARLQSNETFQKFTEAVRQAMIADFVDSGFDETETREEAHAILRALSKIEGILQGAVNAGKVLDRQNNKGAGT